MSFRDWTRTSEPFVLKTAPDVRRTKGGGDRSFPLFTSKSSSASHIPVIERKIMFENQTDSVLPERSSSTSSGTGHKRGNRTATRKDLNRSSSFRASKRMKVENDGSPVMRPKQFPSGPVSTWQKLRNFGHYDLQSVGIDRFVQGCRVSAEHNIKKATGASAAASADGGSIEDSSNELVASCPAFKTDIGSYHNMNSERDFLSRFKDHLSYDKRKRVCTREKLLFDGEIPVVEPMVSDTKSMRHSMEVLHAKSGIHYPFEFIDFGASYYRNYFLHEEHQNFFGVDENIGPVAISLKRERIPDEIVEFYGAGLTAPKYQHRVIMRTSQLISLRGAILEESIPSGAKTDTSKGIPPRDVVEYICQGELQTSSLKLAKFEKKVHNELVRLDEQELNNKYKIGVLYCKKGQTTEEEIYNNEFGSDAFEEFLEVLGSKVKMRGFTKYRAQLDNKTDTTGEYSVYTEFKDTEIMFHVSTLLPYTSSNKQQLLRKRHIGNDIVTVIFQDPGCEAFSPRCIRSQFQHIFIVVRVENPCSPITKYRVAVTRSQDIPYFGPEIPDNAAFDKNQTFKEFILSKLINACNASLRSNKFSAMAVRTRKQYLTDLAESHVTAITVDQANTSGRVAGILRNLGHKKKERARQESTLFYTPGALTWKVSIILRNGKPLPFSEEFDTRINCIMAMGPDLIAFIDLDVLELLLHIPMRDISGWVQDGTRINIFYDVAYCISMECCDYEEDVLEIVTRLKTLGSNLTSSHEAILMDFQRNTNGMLGFGIDESGVVRKVDGLAKTTGLQVNSRILQVEDRLVCCHSHSDILEVLTDKHRLQVKAYVVPPCPPLQSERATLFYPDLNWLSIWSNRPSHSDTDENKKRQNGTPAVESQVKLRKHRRTVSYTNRSSYMEAVQAGDLTKSQQVDDNEPLYDRLEGSTRKSKSPLGHRKGHEDNAGYLRVKRTQKTTRESVVHIAEDLVDRRMGQGWESEPMEHTIDEVSPHIKAQISSSTKIPPARPHTAAPLSQKFQKRTSSQDQRQKGGESAKSDVSHTPGQVTELTKRFSFTPSSPTSSKPPSKIPVISVANVPMKATTSASEMTKSNIPIRSEVSKPTMIPVSNGIAEVKYRSKQGSRSVRPMSWDASLLLNNQDRFVPHSSMDLESQSFSRNSNVRLAFRKKSQSGEDESQEEFDQIHLTVDDLTLAEREQWLAEEARLSQGSSQNSQGSGSNIPLSVRERTKKWEERGGGVPSYFSTLPKSFRHKAKKARKREIRDSISPASPSSIQSPTSGHPTLLHRSTVPTNIGGSRSGTVMSKSGRVSVSNIPLMNKATNSPQPSATATSAVTRTLGMVSVDGSVPPREEADGSSNPDDLLQKPCDNDHSGKAGESSAISPTCQPVIKTRSVNITVTKSRTGQPILPTKTLLPASSNITVSSSRNQAPTETDKGKLSVATHENAGNPPQTESGNGSKPDTQFGGVTNDLQKLSLSVKPTSQRNTEMDIKEWIRQTSAMAVAPDTLVSNEPRDTNSPTLTDSSLADSFTSDYSQKDVDKLKQRVDFLESKLDKETESNTELRTKLKKMEKQLHEMQAKKKKHKNI